MAGRAEGKVAFVTGAARGQGRSHAIRLAEEGADIIAVDICSQIDSVPYPMSTPDDLAETVKQVEALDRRIVATQADVRDYQALKQAVDDGVTELGRLDIVCANAGISGFGATQELSETSWQDMIDVNLTGAWHTCKATTQHLLGNLAHYNSAKHGLVGLMRTLANELAPHFIRVNSVHPTTVNTEMIQNEMTYKLFRPDLEHPTAEDGKDAFTSLNALPIPWVEARDISNAVLFLASDEARYITGVTLPVDAGAFIK
jgi:(+)-trans-carveol dehydrogenase